MLVRSERPPVSREPSGYVPARSNCSSVQAWKPVDSSLWRSSRDDAYPASLPRAWLHSVHSPHIRRASPDDMGLCVFVPARPPALRLVSGSCSSGRSCACGFLPTTHRCVAVADRLGVPVIKVPRGLAPLRHFPIRVRYRSNKAGCGGSQPAVLAAVERGGVASNCASLRFDWFGETTKGPESLSASSLPLRRSSQCSCTSRLVGSVRRADPRCRAACARASAWTR